MARQRFYAGGSFRLLAGSLCPHGCGGFHIRGGFHIKNARGVSLGGDMKQGGGGKAEMDRILRQELSQLLDSPLFSRSPVQSRLLRYLVEYRLQGNLPPPKAYAIATEALGRPADFDTSVDSYPRVMVGRLRALLERYYSERAWVHRLRIPQGSYEVVVQYRAAPPSRSGDMRAANPKAIGAWQDDQGGRPKADGPGATSVAAVHARTQGAAGSTGAGSTGNAVDGGAGGGYDALTALLLPMPILPDRPRTRWGRLVAWLDDILPQPHALRRWTMIVAAVCLAAMLGGVAALLANWYGKQGNGVDIIRPLETAKGWVPMPLVAVRVVAADKQDPVMVSLANAMAAHMRDGARRFEMLSLLAGTSDSSAARRDRPHERGDYLVDVVLTRIPKGQVDAAVMVHRLADQRSIWSHHFVVAATDAPDFSALDPAISQIAGNYGVIVRDQTGHLADDYRAGFPCLAQFQRLRVARQRDGMDKIGQCLSDNLVTSPRDPLALSAQSYWLYETAIGHGMDEKAQAKQANKEEGMRHAAAAYAANPSSPQAAFAQAWAYFSAGQCTEMLSMGHRAVDGNDLDADMLGRLANMYQFCGRAEEADHLSSRALFLDPAFPARPMVTRAFLSLQQGKPQEAIKQLEGLANIQAVEADYHVIQAVAYGQLGMKTNAGAQWRQLIALAGMAENARAEEVLRHFHVADIIVRREVMMLQDAGVVPLRTAD